MVIMQSTIVLFVKGVRLQNDIQYYIINRHSHHFTAHYWSFLARRWI